MRNNESEANDISLFEFHITRRARDKYQIDDAFFSIHGAVIYGSFYKAREFAETFNKGKTDAQKVAASDLFAMGLLDEVLHFVIAAYGRQVLPDLFEQMDSYLSGSLGESTYHKLLEQFVDRFPNSDVYKNRQSAAEYLAGKTGQTPNKHIALEEMLALWLDNRNPAYKPIKELIDESELLALTPYQKAFSALNSFFKKQPPFGKERLPLIDFLLLPSKKFPHSLAAQLEYIKEHWAELIEPILSRLLISLDFIKEEHMARFDAGQFGPGPTYVLEFEGEDEFEPEHFSQDLDWMPRLVVIAKSTYVWLDQLSKQYQRPITRLDQIPDEELDRLAGWGFSGLWLIGLWERSKASRKIKQIRGNPEAVASAYSLYDYIIAYDLGGEEAYQNLRERAWQRGIRLASDMVPNHMGIDSRWVIEQPHWFIQSPHPPFPSYRFTGENLSEDDRVSIYIEDGYWNQTDAAVVFKRVDNHTGEARYIYHGNDGTSMPWNDTAQLNYLMAEVREAVIQTILHVARKFPIIRFDAAMTLAKKHYQRLWFPLPGSGGDIPSRAEYAMSKEEFNRHFPKEFWREVVDRVQQEVPDTLLLAEAFWMMEGYFVRSLGMHRVYNSAFMNMLKNEENSKYRLSVKNVLEFNPQILKRYVNFMNNPDEETAVAQFGKGDKYFGVCIMMATMPGLPMFGHGQIEGFAEKYGMEYKKAYWDETPDGELIDRHEREIFPLLRKRYLFSDVENFFLYDFYRADGSVNENVFAYSNRAGNEKALVLYHNKYEQAAGFVRTSAAYLENGQLAQKALWQGLDLQPAANRFVIFKDHISGLEFIRSTTELAEQGLYAELGAFKYQVFVNFREVRHSGAEPFAELHRRLKGRGVPSVQQALEEFLFEPLISAWDANLSQLLQALPQKEAPFAKALKQLLEVAASLEGSQGVAPKVPVVSLSLYRHMLHLKELNGKKSLNAGARSLLQSFAADASPQHRALATFLLLYGLSWAYPDARGAFIRERHLDKIVQKHLVSAGLDDGSATRHSALFEALIAGQHLWRDMSEFMASSWLEALFDNASVRQLLGVNRFEDVLYFSKEGLEQLLPWMFVLGVLAHKKPAVRSVNKWFRQTEEARIRAEANGYRLLDFLKAIEYVVPKAKHKN